MMIEIDVRGFHGDRNFLAKLLQEKLKVQVRTERNAVRIGGDRPESDPGLQEVKDLVKKALHHMNMDDYHVTVQERVLTIRERKARARYEKRKGSVPSAQRTVPYFFPG